VGGVSQRGPEGVLKEITDWARAVLGYRFADPRLLLQALTHASFSNEPRRVHNERMEFLGDSVLSAAVSCQLFHLFPNDDEGSLTRKRVAVVCNENLSKMGRELGVALRIRMGRSMEAQMAQGEETVVADAVEALVGAVFLDGGFDEAEKVVKRIFFSRDIPMYSNAKGFLQELVVARFGVLPVYHHSAFTDRFESRVEINGRCMGVGVGRSKRDADQRAAGEALVFLKGED